jgi:hypothetical protein
VALFAGLASAQVTGQNQMICNTNVSVTPLLRAEGFTEQTGDITLTCTGGAVLAAGAQIPQVNITVFLNTAVTSRLLPISGGSSAVSEALLLIDEPGSGLTGYGPSLAQKICTTPTTGCVQYVGATGVAPGPTAPFLGTQGTAVTNVGGVGSTPGENVFQGIWIGNSVTFFGVPVLPPTTTGSRVYRITNIRANATTLGSSASGATPVGASISISGATSLLIQNATPTVGFVLKGLDPTTGASGPTALNQCSSQTRVSVTTLSFVEGFGTAFKTRVQAQSTASFAGQGYPLVTGNQNVPGQIYNSESNFILPGTSGGQVAGLADFGTRLKATFSNIPLGIPSIFVSVRNVFNNGSPVPEPANPGGSAANTGTTGYAVLVNGETTSDGNAGVAGFFPSVASSTFAPGGSGNVPVAEIAVVNGTATATWEVINTNPNASETLKFAVYTSFSANVGTNLPGPTGPTGASVSLSFAPTPPAFSATAGGQAQPTGVNGYIPRFIGTDPGGPRNILIINVCRTILLFPYVVNVAGYDTGMAIANTSSDPFGTGAQSGTCALNWYQGATNPPIIVLGDQGSTGTVAAPPAVPIKNGTVSPILASASVPGFNGYMIAVCNFQYAHGFAFISDVGGRNIAEGYLAIVIPDPGTGSRNATPPCQGISGCSTTGEQGGH